MCGIYFISKKRNTVKSDSSNIGVNHMSSCFPTLRHVYCKF